MEALVDVDVRDIGTSVEGDRRAARRRRHQERVERATRLMILGLGSDICDIRRIEKAHRDVTATGSWSASSRETERAKAMRRPRRSSAATFAKRFAAKEAAAKALGTGFRSGVFFSDLGVVNLPGGQPTLQMTGGAAERLRAITPPGWWPQVALTMTDEYPYAYAQVIISAVPDRMEG